MTITELKEFIASDLYRYTGEVSAYLVFKNYFLNLGFKYTFWLRLCKANFILLRWLAKTMHWRLSRKFLIQIPARTTIGYGLYLGHHMCVVIHPSAVMGDNVNLSQFVTIGANNGKAAIIGSNVYIGPGCCLVENIKIGNNVTVGAGSVVVKSVEDDCTVAGVPAEYINSKNPGRYVIRRWESNK
ncbi:serine O-acetyltransferase [Halopseudomonas bauzanensis]|uniref:serine O-acetyltransferase n=1 Tax=Halopseudomonas bauzanensis TaxID=653930 RepID=UPI002552EAF7|nr:serine acetyltransferase [Halopseudomonas bauzanensis]